MKLLVQLASLGTVVPASVLSSQLAVINSPAATNTPWWDWNGKCSLRDYVRSLTTTNYLQKAADPALPCSDDGKLCSLFLSFPFSSVPNTARFLMPKQLLKAAPPPPSFNRLIFWNILTKHKLWHSVTEWFLPCLCSHFGNLDYF